jgi:hypothetical protein
MWQIVGVLIFGLIFLHYNIGSRIVPLTELYNVQYSCFDFSQECFLQNWKSPFLKYIDSHTSNTIFEVL